MCALESPFPLPLYFHSQLLGLILTMFSWVSILIFFFLLSSAFSLSSSWDNEFTGKWSFNTESEYFQRFTECNMAQDKKYHFVTPCNFFCMLRYITTEIYKIILGKAFAEHWDTFYEPNCRNYVLSTFPNYPHPLQQLRKI